MKATGLDQFVSKYEDMVGFVNEFNCGIKFDNATAEGTQVTMALTLTDPVTGEKYIVGDSYTFTYTPEEVALPEFNVDVLPEGMVVEADTMTSSATEEYALDFGMVFEALEDYGTAKEAPYAKWIADFELEFSKDSKITLLGQYDGANNGKWLSLGSHKVEGGRAVKIMKESTLDQFVKYYEDVVGLVKKFNCGIVLDEVEFGTDITLKLCLANPETGDKYTLGAYTYEYKLNEATDTNAEIVENINDMSASLVETNAEEVKNAIVALDQESKDNVSADVIKALVGDAIDETATEPAAYSADPTVTVEVEEPDATDVVPEALNGSEALDIVVKENGVEVEDVDVPVLIAIPVDPDAVIEKVVHVHKGVVKEIKNFVVEDGMLYIQMSEFSYIGIFYAQTVPAGEAVLKLVEVEETDARYEEGKAKFDVVLEGDTLDVVKNFVAGEFTVAVNGNSASYNYEIAANNAAETTIRYTTVNDSTRDYNLYLSGSDVNAGVITGFVNGTSWTSLITDKKLVLGTLTITSYGTGSIQLSDVLMMKHDGSNENLAVEIPTTVGSATAFDVKVPSEELTINVVFNNRIENTDPLYNKMTITISDGDLVDDIRYSIGENVQGVVYDDASCTYTVQANLSKNTEYCVTITGEGYRTARYFVNMKDSARTLTFWNNAKNAAIAQTIEVDAAGVAVGTPVTTNFLAGDIIADNIINIYDLSAVVSYFGEEGLTASNKSEYVKYDLNRDGKIDSKDVAYVLVSWEK